MRSSWVVPMLVVCGCRVPSNTASSVGAPGSITAPGDDGRKTRPPDDEEIGEEGPRIVPVAPEPGDVRAAAGEEVRFEIEVPDFDPSTFVIAPWTRIDHASVAEGTSHARLSIRATVGAYPVWIPEFRGPDRIAGPRIVRDPPKAPLLVSTSKEAPSGILEGRDRAHPQLVIRSTGSLVDVVILGSSNSGICSPELVLDGDVVVAAHADRIALTAFVRLVSSDFCRRRIGSEIDPTVLVIRYADPQRRTLDARVFARPECHGPCVVPDGEHLELHEWWNVRAASGDDAGLERPGRTGAGRGGAPPAHVGPFPRPAGRP